MLIWWVALYFLLSPPTSRVLPSLYYALSRECVRTWNTILVRRISQVAGTALSIGSIFYNQRFWTATISWCILLKQQHRIAYFVDGITSLILLRCMSMLSQMRTLMLTTVCIPKSWAGSSRKIENAVGGNVLVQREMHSNWTDFWTLFLNGVRRTNVSDLALGLEILKPKAELNPYSGPAEMRKFLWESTSTTRVFKRISNSLVNFLSLSAANNAAVINPILTKTLHMCCERTIHYLLSNIRAGHKYLGSILCRLYYNIKPVITWVFTVFLEAFLW